MHRYSTYNKLKGGYFVRGILLAFISLVLQSSQLAAGDPDVVNLRLSSFDNEYHSAFLTDRWLFHNEDDPAYASPDLSDSTWTPISTTLTESDLQIIDWNGKGWFRLHLDIDSTLVGTPLMLDELQRSGIAEIWLNGKQLYKWDATAGVFGSSLDIGPVFSFSKPGHHLMAVRYINSENRRFSQLGFRYDLVKADNYIYTTLERFRQAGSLQFFITGTLLVFCLIHILLFLFYRRHLTNLYFAVFCALLGLYMYFHYQSELLAARQPEEFILFLKVLRSLVMLGFIRFVYEILQPEGLPVYRFSAYTLAFMLDIILYAVNPAIIHNLLTEIIILVFLLELGYLLIRGWRKKLDGIAIFGVGMAGFLIAQVISIIQLYDGFTVADGWVELSGIGILLTAMSVTLSRRFALTSLHLEEKLREVRTLSQKALEEEQRRRESEINRKLLEADNERKTKELEEARALQLSMLPSHIPDTSHFKITAGMRTATEVGGDYYDYAHNRDGNMVIALGDATGHGARAGILVTAAKSAFHAGVKQFHATDLLKEMSSAIRSLNLKGIYMSMTLAECNGSNVTLTQAGMPPVIHYCREKGEFNLYSCKGMPLGSAKLYKHDTVQIEMNSGDLLVLMSDGLPEAINRYDFMAGYEQIKRVLHDLSDQPLNKIYDELTGLVTDERGNTPPPDDITLVLLRY